MPLHSRASAIMAEVAKGADAVLTRPGGMMKLLRSLGLACVGQIHDAFASRGFGTWAALKPETITHKKGKNPNPLVNTQQLNRSITFAVEKL
jgi:hypothetical protein